MMSWKRASLAKAFWPLRYVFVLALAIGGLIWALQSGAEFDWPNGYVPWGLVGNGCSN